MAGDERPSAEAIPGSSSAQPAATANATTSPLIGARDDTTWLRLEEQLAWYDDKSRAAQRAYKRLKVVQIVAAACVPALIALEVPLAVSAGIGVVVVVLEAVQQLYQFQSNWITYRSTAEALKHERYLYLADAGPYWGSDRHRVLAERIEGLVSQEHAKWTESRREPPAPDSQGG